MCWQQRNGEPRRLQVPCQALAGHFDLFGTDPVVWSLWAWPVFSPLRWDTPPCIQPSRPTPPCKEVGTISFPPASSSHSPPSRTWGDMRWPNGLLSIEMPNFLNSRTHLVWPLGALVSLWMVSQPSQQGLSISSLSQTVPDTISAFFFSVGPFFQPLLLFSSPVCLFFLLWGQLMSSLVLPGPRGRVAGGAGGAQGG